MTIVTVINRKGGCGKSTLAAHLAVWLSQGGRRVMLADVDFQQSIVSWLQRRRAQEVVDEIHGWVTDSKNVLRPPAGVMHSVVDTPGGLHGFELARLLVFADIVLMPVCDSQFDYDAAAACLAEMRAHPRVASGRVRIAAIGMRIQPRSAADQRARAWSAEHDVEYLGSIRMSSIYVRCAGSGLTIFDLPPLGMAGERAQWQPVLDWLDAALEGSKIISMARKGRPVLAPGGDRRGPDGAAEPTTVFLPSRMPEAQMAGAIQPDPMLRRVSPPGGFVRRVLRLLPSFRGHDRVLRAP